MKRRSDTGLPVNTLVIIIIALVVLIFIILIFTSYGGHLSLNINHATQTVTNQSNNALKSLNNLTGTSSSTTNKK